MKLPNINQVGKAVLWTAVGLAILNRAKAMVPGVSKVIGQ